MKIKTKARRAGEHPVVADKPNVQKPFKKPEPKKPEPKKAGSK